MRGALVCGALLGPSSLSACVDPGDRYDAFLERTAEMRNRDSGMVEPTDRFDWSGRYLLALSTVLAPDQPLLFAVEAEVSSDLSLIDLQLQPLATDGDEEPRTAIGDSFGVNDIPYEMDGSFSADLGEVTVPGRANPITGSEIVASVQLSASTRAGDDDNADLFCGQVTGMVIQPLSYDLAGSTFGAVLTDDAQNAAPQLRCPR